jgi:uridine kinase
LVLFNKIEEFEINKNYKIIENDNFLNDAEKNLAKVIINKIIDEKKALDLNILEENFEDIL